MSVGAPMQDPRDPSNCWISQLFCPRKSATSRRPWRSLKRPGFGAHLLDWEGGCHAEESTTGDPGEGDTFGP